MNGLELDQQADFVQASYTALSGPVLTKARRKVVFKVETLSCPT